MRYKVTTEFGYVSFDESDEEKMFEYYDEQISLGREARIFRQVNVLDEGILIRGKPVFQDLEHFSFSPKN